MEFSSYLPGFTLRASAVERNMQPGYLDTLSSHQDAQISALCSNFYLAIGTLLQLQLYYGIECGERAAAALGNKGNIFRRII